MLLNLIGKISFITLLSFVLVACGGSGSSTTDSGSSTTDSGSSTTEGAALQTRDVAVTIATEDAVLKGAIDIVEVQSPFGEASVGGSVPVIGSNVETRNLLFAVTDDGSPMMLSFSSGEATFSVESTVLALIEIAAGFIGLPDETTPEDMANLAKNSDQYNNFINLVTSSIDNRQAPSESSEVLSALVALTQDVLTSQFANTTQTKGIFQNITSTPFDILSYDPVAKLELSEAGYGNNLQINNTTFLQWHVETKYMLSDFAYYEKYLEPISFGDKVLNNDNVHPLQTLDEAYKLRVHQDALSRNNNLIALMSTVVGAMANTLSAMSGVQNPVLQCMVDSTKDFFVAFPESLENLTTAISEGEEGLSKNMTQTALKMFQDASNYFANSCFDTSVAVIAESVAGVAWGQTVGRVFAAVNAAKDGALALTSLAQIVAYSDYDKAFEVCMYDGKVMPCVRTIAIDQENPIGLALYDSKYIKILAFGDGEIPITTSLPFTVTSSNTLEVSVLDQETTEIATGVPQDYYYDEFVVVAEDYGNSKITITDPVTQTSKEFLVEVPEPTLSITSAICSLYNIDKSDPSEWKFEYLLKASGTATYLGDSNLSSVTPLSYPANTSPAGMLDVNIYASYDLGPVCDNWTGRYYDDWNRPQCYKRPGDPDETSWTESYTITTTAPPEGMPGIHVVSSIKYLSADGHEYYVLGDLRSGCN